MWRFEGVWFLLSGGCDGDPTNDLVLPNGTAVSESEDPALFIDSWQLPNTTGYISHSRRREVNCSTSDCSRCLAMLTNQTFTACHAFVRTRLVTIYWNISPLKQAELCRA